MSEDPEIAKIMQKKLDAMINQKPEPKIEPGIIDLNDSNFDQIISAETPTLVDFWAEWCGPCKQLGPTVEEVASEYSEQIKVCNMDVDSSRDIAAKYRILSIPTLIIFKEGEPSGTEIGALSKQQLVEFVNSEI